MVRLYLGGIPGPLTVEFVKVYRDPFIKMNRFVISLLVGGGYHQAIWGFPKMVVPNNHGFPTKNDHVGVFWGYHHLRKHPYPNLWKRPNSSILTFDWSCQMRLRLSCWSRDKSNVLPQWVLKETMCWAIFQFQKNFCNLPSLKLT